MQSGTGNPGPSDGANGTDDGREGPVFPHVDDIEIPDDLAVEAAEPIAHSADPERHRRRGPASRLVAGAWRLGTGLRGAIDRALLVVTFVVPLLILAYQSFEWLRTSGWPSVTLERLLASLDAVTGPSGVAGWPGLDGLLDVLLGAPLAVVLFAGGFFLHLLLALLVPAVRRD